MANCFLGDMLKKILVFRGVPLPVIAWPRVSVPLNSLNSERIWHWMLSFNRILQSFIRQHAYRVTTRCATKAFHTTCAVNIGDYKGWWLSSCRSSVRGKGLVAQARCPGFDYRWLLAFSLSSSSVFNHKLTWVAACISIVVRRSLPLLEIRMIAYQLLR